MPENRILQVGRTERYLSPCKQRRRFLLDHSPLNVQAPQNNSTVTGHTKSQSSQSLRHYYSWSSDRAFHIFDDCRTIRRSFRDALPTIVEKDLSFQKRASKSRDPSLVQNKYLGPCASRICRAFRNG